MITISILKKNKGFVLFMIAYWIVCFIMILMGFPFLYLCWNTFLAFLPLFFINVSLDRLINNKKISSIILLLLWLLFFPNSIYLVTDFIHISNYEYYWFDEITKYSADRGLIYNYDIMIWLKLLMIGIGAFYGIIVGMESLYIFYNFMKTKTSMLISCFSVLTVSLLSGFGIFIGRFLRFNSWDIINPISLFKGIISGLNWFSIQFTCSFAFFILVIFILYSLLRKNILSNKID